MPPRRSPTKPGSTGARAHPERASRQQRRALTHAGGEVTVEAEDPADTALLEHALQVTPDEQEVSQHVHGFHSYPARLHPYTAARLIEGLSEPGSRLLDPFCGSGTVLVEGRGLGRRCLGVDSNPLAIELSWLKTHGFSESELGALAESGTRVAEQAEQRRLRKAGPTRRYGREDRDLFDTHILLELDGLRQGIESLRAGVTKRALWLVLSSILVKLSHRAADTSGKHVPRRLAGGFGIRLFGNKLGELCARLREYAARIPTGAPRCRVEVGDARRLGFVHPASVPLVVTSPPYPGVYDYLDHHALRLRWLGLGGGRLVQHEIGSRRQLGRLTAAEARQLWDRDFGRSLTELGRVLAPGGVAALVLADSVVGGAPLRANEVVERLAAHRGLRLRARASQPRPYFHAPTADAFGRRPRCEWVILLTAPPRPGSGSSPDQRRGRPRRA